MADKGYIYLNDCPLCGSKNITKKFKIFRNNDNVINKINIKFFETFLYECKFCKFNFSNPQINNELLSKYYKFLDSEYYDYYQFETDISTLNSTREILCIIKRLKHSGDILEIGCGSGALLNYIEKSGEYKCVGLEPSPVASNYGINEFGLNIKKELVGEINPFKKKFNIILLIDVIEHLRQPLEVLKNLYFWLADDGIIIVSTGNVKSVNARTFRKFWGYFSSWEHISFFSKQSFYYLAKKTNYKILELKFFCYSDKKIKNIGFYFYNFYLIGKNILKYGIKILYPYKYKYSLSKLSNDHFIAVIKKS